MNDKEMQLEMLNDDLKQLEAAYSAEYNSRIPGTFSATKDGPDKLVVLSEKIDKVTLQIRELE